MEIGFLYFMIALAVGAIISDFVLGCVKPLNDFFKSLEQPNIYDDEE